MDEELELFTLPAGTVVHLRGIPILLQNDTFVVGNMGSVLAAQNLRESRAVQQELTIR